MRIERIRIKNFRAFQDVEMRDIPPFAILVGANGTGKSTLFSVFGFLRDAMNTNVRTALAKLGGSRGFREVVSRDAQGPIDIEIKYRLKPRTPLVTYRLAIDVANGKPEVDRELLAYRRFRYGKPWHFLDFQHGSGYAVTNEAEDVEDYSQLERDDQSLKSPDVLAIKGLAQFERFPAVVALGNLVENWHVSDLHISKARTEPEAGFADHLSREGENLPLVIEYLHNEHRDTFDRILELLRARVPGMSNVEAKQTEEGRILLRFRDGTFADPFLARYVSDGTIKMLAYLTLLYDPAPHPLLCVEEPENQLYPTLLEELAQEFRAYANRGGQVFVSTHSPDFLNAARLDEVFWLQKEDGYTRIRRASEDAQVATYMDDGGKMGWLWKQGLFEGVDPEA